MAVSTCVELREAGPDDVPVLRRLMQLYLYELGTLDGWDIGADGLYGEAQRIESFWTEPERHSYLVQVDAVLGGFALVRHGTRFAGSEAYEISEFFILARTLGGGPDGQQRSGPGVLARRDRALHGRAVRGP
jgi:hypothetical protein